MKWYNLICQMYSALRWCTPPPPPAKQSDDNLIISYFCNLSASEWAGAGARVHETRVITFYVTAKEQPACGRQQFKMLAQAFNIQFHFPIILNFSLSLSISAISSSLCFRFPLQNTFKNEFCLTHHHHWENENVPVVAFPASFQRW